MKSQYRKILAMSLAMMLILTGCTTKGASANAVAKVGNTEISIESFNKNFKMVERSYTKMYGESIWTQQVKGKPVKQLVKEEILQNMINETMIVDYVKATGYQPDQKEVDTSYKKFADTLTKDAETTKFMADNKIDEAFVKKEIEAQLYSEEFKRKLADDLKKDTAKMDELAKTYIVKVSARHILVDDEKTAQAILDKLKKGEDFAKLAKASSKDPGSAANGGSLGYFGRGMMVAEFETAAFELPVGQISELVKSKFGYHIIKVDARKTLDDLQKEGAKPQEIETEKASILENVSRDLFDAKIKELEKKAEPQKFLDRIK